MLNDLWETLELTFNGKVRDGKPDERVKVRHKRPDLHSLFDQEEHLVHTNKSNIHIMCHLEMFENEVIPVLTIQTTNKDIMLNFMENRGLLAIQNLSHHLRKEYRRMLDGTT